MLEQKYVSSNGFLTFFLSVYH